MAESNWHLQETFKSLITLSTEALKYLALVNGGAAVAGIANGLSKIPNAALRWPLVWFLAGLVLTGLGYIGAYATQLALYNETADLKNGMPPHGNWLRATAAFGVLALAAFAGGCLSVFNMLDG